MSSRSARSSRFRRGVGCALPVLRRGVRGDSGPRSRSGNEPPKSVLCALSEPHRDGSVPVGSCGDRRRGKGRPQRFEHLRPRPVGDILTIPAGRFPARNSMANPEGPAGGAAGCARPSLAEGPVRGLGSFVRPGARDRGLRSPAAGRRRCSGCPETADRGSGVGLRRPAPDPRMRPPARGDRGAAPGSQDRLPPRICRAPAGRHPRRDGLADGCAHPSGAQPTGPAGGAGPVGGREGLAERHRPEAPSSAPFRCRGSLADGGRPGRLPEAGRGSAPRPRTGPERPRFPVLCGPAGELRPKAGSGRGPGPSAQAEPGG